MYPHERSLVSKLANKPFALLGINSDNNRNELKKVLVKEKITWRSWWNGGSPSGPIAAQYKVGGWPTIYILDARGVIRHKQEGGPVPDAVIDALLKEVGDGPIVKADATPEVNPETKRAEKTKTVAAAKPPVDDAKKAEQAAESKLKLAKQLEKDGAKDKARTRYQEIVDKYPKTEAANEARELLANLPK